MATLRVWNASIDPTGAMAGMLTCVARSADDPGRFYALSAAHVLAPLPGPHAARGPLPDDEVVCVLAPGDAPRAIGRLAYWVDLQPRSSGFANRMDVALVDVDGAVAATLLQRLAQPAAMVADGARRSVRFDGLEGLSASALVGDAQSPLATYPMLGGGFADLQLVEVVPAPLHSLAGDSGALVIAGDGAVGMLVVSIDTGSGYYRLQPIFEALNLAWIDTSAVAPPAAAPAPALDVFRPDVDAAIDTLARTLWGEARGEPQAGIRAVAAVVLNRAGHRRVHWWGSDVVGVCRRPMQFSCWNADDPNRPKLMAVTDQDLRFRRCLQVARDAAAGRLAAECAAGATHYHTRSILPAWARGHLPCAEVGNHVFYNDIEA